MKAWIYGNKRIHADSSSLPLIASGPVYPQTLPFLSLSSHRPPCPFALRILLFLLFTLSLFSSLLPLAKVQRRGLPVADDQRGFPFSTPCCCCCCVAAPPPSSSLPSSSLFSRALGTIILRDEIRRGFRVERLRGIDAARGYRADELGLILGDRRLRSSS